MPTLVRRELEVLLRDEFPDVEQQLRPRIADVVMSLQPRLIDLYKQSQLPLSEYGPGNDSSRAGGSDTGLTPAMQPTGPDTGSTSADGETGYSYNAGVGAWDDPLSGELDPDFSWDNEFDNLLNPDLFMPQGLDANLGGYGQANLDGYGQYVPVTREWR